MATHMDHPCMLYLGSRLYSEIRLFIFDPSSLRQVEMKNCMAGCFRGSIIKVLGGPSMLSGGVF